MSSIKNRRAAMASTPCMITSSDVFSVGVDTAIAAAAKTVSADPDQVSSVKTVLIGQVPDRGGRTGEMRPKGSDLMPSWQSRKESTSSSGGKGSKTGKSSNASSTSNSDLTPSSKSEAADINNNKVCFAFKKGNCNRGSKCKFSHA